MSRRKLSLSNISDTAATSNPVTCMRLRQKPNEYGSDQEENVDDEGGEGQCNGLSNHKRFVIILPSFDPFVIPFDPFHKTLTVRGVNPYGQPDC